ncbi:uncharacterized protein LOC135649187 isoform X3 [Musa acuminata AAA Group]|uniref:uncharacterized protein LOC103981473 isoform X3 n=1 Tax=Musa acuminata AAA Group TaxID=214697 RepID=UPI0031E101DB
MDISEGRTFGCRNVCSSDLNDLGLTTHVPKSSEFMGAEKIGSYMKNSVLQKDVKSYDEVVIPDKSYLHRHQDSSINWENYKACHCPDSEGITSEQNHIPIDGINKKIKSNLNQRQGPGHDQVVNRTNESQMPLKKTALSSHLTAFAAGGICFEARRMTKISAQEIKSSESIQGSQPIQDEFTVLASHSARNNFTNSPIYIKDKRVSSVSDHMIEEHLEKARLANLKHELHNFTRPSRVTVSEMKDENEIANSERCSWPKINHRSLQKPGDSWPGDFPHPSTDRDNNTLIVDSTETGKAKGTALFEMITGPTTSKCHGKQSGDSLLLINSNGIRDGDDGVGNGKGNGRHTTATRKESSAKTETMDIEVCQTRSSLIGSCVPQRDEAPLSISFTNQTNCESACYCCFLRQNRWYKPMEAEPYGKWLKRLGPDPYAFGHRSKRMKIRDGPTGAEMCRLSSNVHNDNTSSSDLMKCPEKQQSFDRAKNSPSIPECCCELSAKTTWYWIERWCHRSPQRAKAQASAATTGLSKPRSPKVVPEYFEGKELPSIRALALMGKAMNNSRKGEFQRRGSSVVWHTEDL